MPRNLLIDVAALAGAEVAQLAVVAKRFDRPGSDSRDVHGPRKYLHLEVGNAPGNSDFGRAHRNAYEYLPDIPPWAKARNGASLFAYDGVPVLSSPPGAHGPRRNLVLDVEEVASGAMLLAAVLVHKRHPGGSRGPDTFVHAMFAEEDGLPDDLAAPSAHAREFLQGVPAAMRRADGGPLHVFLGNEVYETKPTPSTGPPS